MSRKINIIFDVISNTEDFQMNAKFEKKKLHLPKIEI